MSNFEKYATATHLYKPILKRGVVDFAVGADWTPAAGDVKISINGGAAANVANLPTAIVMGNTAMWDFSLTSGELTGAKIRITIADAATKAVEDQFFEIFTYGNASAHFVQDWSVLGASAAALATVQTDTDDIQTRLTTLQADTDDLQTRTPAALVSGRMDASVGAMAANVMTAAAAAADLTTELQTGLATPAAVLAAFIADSTYKTAIGASTLAAFIADPSYGVKRVNTAQGGSINTITLDAGASAVDDAYRGDFIIPTIDGAVDGLVCTGYVGATKVATMEGDWKGGIAPDSNDPFAIIAGSPGIEGSTFVEAVFARDMGGKFNNMLFAELLLAIAAALTGKSSGLPAAPKYRDPGDTQNVIDSVSDTDGNRSSVTLNTAGA